MTTLPETQWLTYAEYRALLGLPPLTLIAAGDGEDIIIDSLGRRWDRRKHPRGRDGRFIEVGGLVKFFESLTSRNVAGTGVVDRIDGDKIYVRATHLNNGTDPHNRIFELDKRQIATIPPGEVRLDRNGNVHPDDRELPDRQGKLIRVGDTVTANGRSGTVTRIDENSGRVVVRAPASGDQSELHIMRRAEHVDRHDAPAAASPAAPAARLDRTATPAAPALPSIPQDTADRVARLPVEAPLTPDALESLLNRHGFDDRNVVAAHHLYDPTAIADIRADPKYGRMRAAHDSALHEVMPSPLQERAIRDYRQVEATLNAPHLAPRDETPPAPPTPPAPSVPAAPSPTPRRQAYVPHMSTPEEDINGQSVPDGWYLDQEANSDGRQVFVNDAGYEVHVGDEYELYDPNSEHLGDFSRFDSADREALDHAGANSPSPAAPEAPAPVADVPPLNTPSASVPQLTPKDVERHRQLRFAEAAGAFDRDMARLGARGHGNDREALLNPDSELRQNIIRALHDQPGDSPKINVDLAHDGRPVNPIARTTEPFPRAVAEDLASGWEPKAVFPNQYEYKVGDRIRLGNNNNALGGVGDRGVVTRDSRETPQVHMLEGRLADQTVATSRNSKIKRDFTDVPRQPFDPAAHDRPEPRPRADAAPAAPAAPSAPAVPGERNRFDPNVVQTIHDEVPATQTKIRQALQDFKNGNEEDHALGSAKEKAVISAMADRIMGPEALTAGPSRLAVLKARRDFRDMRAGRYGHEIPNGRPESLPPLPMERFNEDAARALLPTLPQMPFRADIYQRHHANATAELQHAVNASDPAERQRHLESSLRLARKGDRAQIGFHGMHEGDVEHRIREGVFGPPATSAPAASDDVTRPRSSAEKARLADIGVGSDAAAKSLLSYSRAFHEGRGNALGDARYNIEKALLADTPEERRTALEAADTAFGKHVAQAGSPDTPNRNHAEAVRQEFQVRKNAYLALHGGPAPAPALHQARNLPAGRRVETPDTPDFNAAAVDQMLSDLPTARGRHAVLRPNDRYLNNLRYALQDALEGKDQTRQQDGQHDRKIQDYFGRALQGRAAGDPTRTKIEDVQRRWNEMRAGAAAPAAPNAAAAPSAVEYEQRLRAATDATQVDALEQEIEAATHLTESDKNHLAGVVNEIRDAGPGNAATPTPPPVGVPDGPGSPSSPAPPAPRTPPAVGVPDGPGSPDSPVPPAAERAPAMFAGYVPQGRQFRNASVRNQYGEDIRGGMIVRTNGQSHIEGHIVRVHPPSGRVVIEGQDRNGVARHVMRNADTVRIVYNDGNIGPYRPAAPAAPRAATPAAPAAPDVLAPVERNARLEQIVQVRAQAIIDMHIAGRQQGYPRVTEVSNAQSALDSAIMMARSGRMNDVNRDVTSAVDAYRAALARPGAITRSDHRAAIQRRLDAALELQSAVQNHDPVLNVNIVDLRAARGDIGLFRDLTGGTNTARQAYRNAGLALEDALDTSRTPDERRARLQRAQMLIARDDVQRVAGAPAMKTRLAAIVAGTRMADNPPSVEPDLVNFPRVDTVRPTRPDSVKPDATWEDFAQKWGYQRGAEIASAASQRPSLQAVRDAGTVDERRALIKSVFDGTYGRDENGDGLTFAVTSISGSGAGNLFVSGTITSAAGVPAGRFQREIRSGGYVYNQLMSMNDEFQGSGAASDFNRHMENWYIANGLSKVNVSAGLDKGGFVWARNGFDWDGGYQARSLAEKIQRIAQRGGNAEATAQATEILQRINTLDEDHANYPTPYDLSQVGWKPGMKAGVDTWEGQTAMLGTGWSGVKYLDPNARAYKQQVAAGRQTDPALKTPPPARKYYGPQHIPDELRQLTFNDLDTAVPRAAFGGEGRGVIGNFDVVHLGHNPNDPNQASGINHTFIFTSRDAEGRKFVLKRDGQVTGAQAEADVATLLRQGNFFGASYVEVSPVDPHVVIQTFVGEQNGLTDYHLAAHLPGVGTADELAAFVDRIANRDQLIKARVVNAMIGNLDRHPGNAYWAKDAEGNNHLLLFDHGLALSPNMMGTGLENIVRLQIPRIAYKRQLIEHMKEIGPEASAGQVKAIAEELLNVVNTMRWTNPASKAGTVSLLNELIADPTKYTEMFAGTRR